MKAMNLESTGWRRQALDGEILEEDIAAQRRRRRVIIVAAVLGAALIVAAALLFGGGDKKAAPVLAATSNEGPGPRITVIVPGRQQVAKIISATGTLGARRDVPIGVTGEGGRVAQVLVEAGAWVRAGQTLAVIERSVQSEQARQLAANVDVARADAALAQSELNRAQALVSRGFISKADIERKSATRDAANARVRVAQAQLGETRALIGRLDIRAPAAGLILERKVEVGQVVGAGSGTLFRMARGGEMELQARLSQEDLAAIRVGVPATVTPVGSTQSFAGTIWQVSPVIDPQSRQGEARIAIPYNAVLRPGGFASVSIKAGQVDAPLLPQSAVQSDDKGNFVYVVDAANRAQRRNIQVGEVSDAGVAVAAGLNGDESVVLSAGAFLNPGQKVQPVRAAAR
jgi:HlyD family secretion protein